MRSASFLLKFFVLVIGLVVVGLILSQSHPAARVDRSPNDYTIIDRLRAEAQQAQERVSQQINALDSSLGQLNEAATASQNEVDKLSDRVQQMKQALAQQIGKLQAIEVLLEADQGAELPGGGYIAPAVVFQQAEWERAQYQMQKREADRLQDRLNHATAHHSSASKRHEAVRRLRAALAGQREELREILEHPYLSQEQFLLRNSFEFSEIEHDLIVNDRTIGVLQCHVQAMLDTLAEFVVPEGY